jgi:RNA polymerase sigma-70 factor (ECF subfamily)
MPDKTSAPPPPRAAASAGAPRHSERAAQEGTGDLRQDVLALIPSMRAFARSLCRNLSDADDLVQDTLLKALANFHQFSPGTNLRAWLFTILRNTYYTSIRRTRREVTDADPHSFDQPVSGPDQEWFATVRRLQSALTTLNAEQQEALLLVAAAGLTYEEAAVVCNCAVGTIKSRVNRARARLLEALGVTSADDVLFSRSVAQAVSV